MIALLGCASRTTILASEVTGDVTAPTWIVCPLLAAVVLWFLAAAARRVA